MDISQLPFNQLIGLELTTQDSGFLVSLPDSSRYTNHTGTVHGSALLAVVEAGSGAFLAQHLDHREDVVPLVRRVEAKFRKPAFGRVFARCLVTQEDISRWFAELDSRGRLSAAIPMEVVDTHGTVVMSAIVEWFVSPAPNRRQEPGQS